MASTDDMTRGNPIPLMLRFFFPTLIGNVFQQLYNMVDSIIVGRFVGEKALAAVGSTGSIMFLIIGSASGMTAGFCVLTSQLFGAEDHEGTRKSVANAALLTVICSAVLTAAALLALPSILRLMNTPEDIYDMAYAYISTICAGIISTVGFNLVSTLLRSVGNSKMPLIALMFSSVLNVGLDFALIVGASLGTRGAALATVISQGVSALICITYIAKSVPVLRPSFDMYRLDKTYSKRQLSVGIPMGIQFGITASGTMIMQSAYNTFGSDAVATFAACSKMNNVLTQGNFTTGQTIATYVGQNFGSKNVHRIRDGVKKAFLLVSAYNIAIGILMFFAFPKVLPIFFPAGTDVSVFVDNARIYMTGCSICYIFLGFIFVTRNTLNSMSFPMHALVIGIAELVARIIISSGAIFIANFTLASLSDPVAWVLGGLSGIVAYIIVIKRIKKTKEVF